MFNFKEIEFMKIYISLMYKYGYCYFDLSKEYLEGYIHELSKLTQIKKFFDDDKIFENIFLYDELMGNYTNFINIILYVTNNPINSFYNEKADILMVNFNDEIVEQNLSKTKYMDINVVNSIVDYMISYINHNIKIKVITK
ncbi:MAG: hypothetical protein E7157_02975 [Lactobacillales bacterium]|nr:hypothetical protein [Lactobacillales bacterium]